MPRDPLRSSPLAPLPSPAWQQLVQQLHRRRLPVALQGEHEDLIAEALLRACASPPPDGNWAPWVNRIFSNVALDRLRVLTRAARAQAQLAFAPACTPNSPEDNALAQERQRELHAALQTLPPPLHRAVEARFFAHEDDRQTPAQATTTRVHVHRGVARLRGLLSSLRAVFVPVYGPLATSTMGVVVLAQMAISPQPTPMLIAAAHETTSPGRPAVMAEATSRPPRVAADKTPEARSRVQAMSSVSDTVQTPQVFDFDDDVVEGSLTAGDMSLVQVPLVAKHDSLLEIPLSMIEPLLKSLEDI